MDQAGRNALDTAELILYACPIGELADQLAAFFIKSRELFGENTAHHYMPHVTLTGFFHDVPSAVPLYLQALDPLLPPVCPIDVKPVITITRMGFDKNFHRIEVESIWLKHIVDLFIPQAQSATRTDAIRKKDWLHLSLAYEFPPEQAAGLKALAESVIRLDAEVRWVARFYERHPDNSWTCHQEWLL